MSRKKTMKLRCRNYQMRYEDFDDKLLELMLDDRVK